MKCFICMLFCMLALEGSAQGSEYPQGRILDSIPLRNSENESFALYVPNSQKGISPAPIVFIFDPAGRGRSGIAPFVPAAEKYKLILVCSNNSRNSAYEENFNIADRWFKDIFSRFSVDPDHIYAGGFSGGSRRASTIGVLSGSFKGIIGCGAAFSINTDHMPFADDHFNYVGLVGNLDMNYQEMIKAGQWLDQVGLPNFIITFEGRHTWPPQELIVRAFDWFYLQDINSGALPKDQQFLDNYLSEYITRAQTMISTGQWVKGVQHYEHILESLGASFELDSISDKIKQLKKTKQYKRSVKEQNQIALEEREWINKLVGRINQEVALVNGTDNFNWWQKELGRLDKYYVHGEKLHYQQMGKRLQGMIFAVGIERFEFAVANREEKKAAYYADFMSANWPNNAYIQFRTARGYALLGREDEALAYLESALENGWDDKQRILDTNGFESIKNHAKFKALIEQLQ